MSMASNKELSQSVSLQLDRLGFSEERIRERIHTMDKCSRAKDISTKKITGRNDLEKVVVGSKRDGLGLDYVNDTDVLQIDHGIICQPSHRTFAKTGGTAFKIEQKDAPPGHCLLRLVRKDVQSDSYKRIGYALVKRKTRHYLSSDVFMTKNDDIFNSDIGFISQNTHYQPRQGPSLPKYVEGVLLEKYLLSKANLNRKEVDFVRAFPCEADYVLKEWSERKRLKSWPTPETINHVIKQPVYVVPVGQKGSSNEDLQWRICFNFAEIHLVQSFNIIQTKVFVLLKLIAKHILQPVSKCMTSFAMKNVMLWLAEQTPQAAYCEEFLIDRLNDALVYLKECVVQGVLPCYMISKRNLFAGKLQEGEQTLVEEKLNQLLQSSFTAADMYFNSHESNVMHKQINKITDAIFKANVLDKINTCRIAMFSTEQLTEYFLTMFLYESKWKIMFYNIFFHMVPFLYTYGKRGLLEPLSVELSDQLMQEQTAENMALEQRAIACKSPNEWSNPQYKCEEDAVKTPVNILVFSLFVDIILLINIPGLSLIWSCMAFRRCAFLTFCVGFLICELAKTRRRKTYIKRAENNIQVTTYVPKSIQNLSVMFIYLSCLVSLNANKEDYYSTLQYTLWSLFMIVLTRGVLVLKHPRPMQYRWRRVMPFTMHC